MKPASAVCNLDCEYCFYLDRAADPYADLAERTMSVDMLERNYSFAIEDLEDEGPKPAADERILARQVALAGRRRELRVA